MRLWRSVLIGWVLLAAGQMSTVAMEHADHKPTFSSVDADQSQHENHCARHAEGKMPPSETDCCGQLSCNPLFFTAIEPLIDVDVFNVPTGHRSISLPSFSASPIVPPPRG